MPRVSAGRVFFGDKRLDDRLEQTFDEIAKRPGGTLPRKLVKRTPLVGGYRMLNNPKVSHRALLNAHRASCLQRLEGFSGTVLMLHDTTVLDYSGLNVDGLDVDGLDGDGPDGDGLGQVGDGHGKGLYAHNSLAVIPSTRQVVGLFNQILHKRAHVPAKESKSRRRQRQDRESRLWKDAVVDLPELPARMQVIDVSDRGSDLTEYIDYEVRVGRGFIVRSQHNRKLVNDEGEGQVQKLHDRLRSLASMGQYVMRAPAAQGGWREASIALSWETVNILPPRQARGEHGREPITLSGVIARELSAPAGEEKVEWILLTNQPVSGAEQAREVAENYACRWMIEDYHKAMKSGCGIEETQMTTRHGLDNVIGLLSVLAVHVLRLRCNARDEQIRQQPARLHEDPLKVQLAARDAKHLDWETMTTWEFYIAVARMGGYVLNPHKRPPGWTVLWRGYIRLEDMCEGVRLWKERCVQT